MSIAKITIERAVNGWTLTVVYGDPYEVETYIEPAGGAIATRIDMLLQGSTTSG